MLTNPHIVLIRRIRLYRTIKKNKIGSKYVSNEIKLLKSRKETSSKNFRQTDKAYYQYFCVGGEGGGVNTLKRAYLPPNIRQNIAYLLYNIF